MSQTRFGAADYISTRPLLYGLQSGTSADVRLACEAPALLVESFARGRYDAALVPSIEYLRGVGRHVLPGPALIGRSAPGGIVLVAQKDISQLERIAVGEYCRTPVAVLRIVLAEQHGIFPDLLVEKRIDEDDWRDRYDAALLTGDAALREATAEKTQGLKRINVAEMWRALTKTPLVHAVWVYDDATRSGEIARVLAESRRRGLENLSTIADEAGRNLSLEAMTVYDHLTRAWSYDLGEAELEGLRTLNDYARKYDLIRESRIEKALRV